MEYDPLQGDGVYGKLGVTLCVFNGSLYEAIVDSVLKAVYPIDAGSWSKLVGSSGPTSLTSITEVFHLPAHGFTNSDKMKPVTFNNATLSFSSSATGDAADALIYNVVDVDTIELIYCGSMNGSGLIANERYWLAEETYSRYEDSGGIKQLLFKAITDTKIIVNIQQVYR